MMKQDEHEQTLQTVKSKNEETDTDADLTCAMTSSRLTQLWRWTAQCRQAQMFLRAAGASSPCRCGSRADTRVNWGSVMSARRSAVQSLW